ncbi:MAG: TetR family transcriptional regulator [Burkholderiaceae bacterium]
MESVAESAAMSKATVYSFFQDKKQLLDGVARP